MTYFALILFFIVEYLRPGNWIPGFDALRMNSFVPLIAILGTIFRKNPVPAQRLLNEPNSMAMAVFIFILLVSTAFATITTNAFEVTKNIFAYALIYMVLVRQLGNMARLKGVFTTLVAIHLFAIAISPDLLSNSSGRAAVAVGGFLGDGNDFSLSVNMCLPLCLFLALEARKKLARFGWSVAALLLLFSIIATKSRGGTVALVLVGLYFWMKSPRKALTASLVVAAALVVVIAAPPEYFNRMSTVTDTEESSSQARIRAWQTAVSMAAANPLLGAGAGHFPMAYGHANGGRWMTAHSIYFLLLGELGLPGLGVLLFLIFYNLFANSRLQRELKQFSPERTVTASNLLACTSASIVAFAGAGAFLSAAYYPHLYVVSGLLVASRGLVREQLDAEMLPATAAHMPKTETPSLIQGAISPAWRSRVANGSK